MPREYQVDLRSLIARAALCKDSREAEELARAYSLTVQLAIAERLEALVEETGRVADNLSGRWHVPLEGARRK